MIRESEILKRHKQTYPVMVRELIHDLNIKLDSRPLENSMSGFIQRHADDTFTIGVNSDESDQRQRFTCGHELGHYFLHRHHLIPGGPHEDRLFDGKPNPNGNLTRQDEAQANRFAADLLMPAPLVSELWHSPDNTNAAAHSLGVSPLALKWRLVNLRLSTKGDLGLPI